MDGEFKGRMPARSGARPRYLLPEDLLRGQRPAGRFPWRDAVFWLTLAVVLAFVVSAFVLAPDWYAAHVWGKTHAAPAVYLRGKPAKLRVAPAPRGAHHLEMFVPGADPQAPGAWMTVAGMDGLATVALKVSSAGVLSTGADPGGPITQCSGNCAVIGGLSGLQPVALKVGADGTVAISASAGAVTFDVIGAGTNTTAAMIVGTGGSLTVSGGGTINATQLAAAAPVGTFGTSCAAGDITTVCLKDEFIATGPGTLATIGVGDLHWQCSTISSASTFTGSAGVFPNLGISQWTTAAGQGDGSACQLNTAPAQNIFANFGALGSNAPWDSEFIVKMAATTNTRMRIGWMNALSTCYTTNVTSVSATCDGFWVRYDTNIGNGAVNVGNNGITRSSGVVTVTVAAHGLSLVGQSVTIASATGCTTSPNGTFAITSIPSTTTYTFNQAGTNETCGGNTPATSTPVADTDYVFETKSGAGSPVASATDSGVSGVTTFVRARIYSLVAGTICFSIYGPSGTLLNGPVCSSTDVATTNMVPTFMFVTDTAGAKVIQVDYWSFAATGLAR